MVKVSLAPTKAKIFGYISQHPIWQNQTQYFCTSNNGGGEIMIFCSHIIWGPCGVNESSMNWTNTAMKSVPKVPHKHVKDG